MSKSNYISIINAKYYKYFINSNLNVNTHFGENLKERFIEKMSHGPLWGKILF